MGRSSRSQNFPHVSSPSPQSGPAPALREPNPGTAQEQGLVTVTPLNISSSLHSQCLGMAAANPPPSTTPSLSPAFPLACFSHISPACGIISHVAPPRAQTEALPHPVRLASPSLADKEARFVWCPPQLQNPCGQAPTLLFPPLLSIHAKADGWGAGSLSLELPSPRLQAGDRPVPRT